MPLHQSEKNQAAGDTAPEDNRQVRVVRCYCLFSDLRMQRHKLALAELTRLYRAVKEEELQRRQETNRTAVRSMPFYVRQTARGESSKPHRGGIPRQENKRRWKAKMARARYQGASA